MDEALARLTPDRHAIRVAASTEPYGQLRLRDTTVALHGPDDGGQAVFTSEEDLTTIWLYGAPSVTPVIRIDFDGDTRPMGRLRHRRR